ncbi:DUF1904 domain-containing protein [Clostridium sp.]|uniref:DUF1904 domain-containing protein n=1 Tax=Clostridium sp. TaxID=1506 RepID=UPI002FCA49FD
MPILKFNGVESKKLCAISKELVDELENLLKCPREYFSLEVIQSSCVKDGEFVDISPRIEIAWFDRGQELQDQAAKIITRHINSLEYPNVDVVFTCLEELKYYENGEHF